MKKVLVFIVVIAAVVLSGQQFQSISREGNPAPENRYNEKEIMKKQAERLTTRRDYEKANQIYRELMEKYPEDWEIVQDLITNLTRVSRFEAAGKLLEEKKEIFPQQNYLRLKIPLLIRDGDTRTAFKLSDEYLQNNKTNVNIYLELSRLFSGSREYEKAGEILEEARKLTDDKYLFTLDLARVYQSQEESHKAAREYLKHLERNKNYLHYVMNNLKGILHRDASVINTIKKVRELSDNQEIIEVYALSLAYIEDYDAALQQYRNLDSIKLLNFAEELKKMSNYEIALRGFDQYENDVKEPDLKAEARISKAEIYLELDEYEEAEAELWQVYNTEELHTGKYRYRSQSAKQSRLLLSELAIRQDNPSEIVIKYLQEAAQYTLNAMEKKEIEFSVIDYRIKTGELDEAGAQLSELMVSESPGTSIYKQSIYYTWQIALMQKDTRADSLLGELILNLPDSPLTTQALYLTQITASLPSEHHDRLFEAWRLKGLFKTERAVEILSEIFEISGNDEIKLLAAEWQKENNLASSLIWWQKDYESDLLTEYAHLQIMENSVSDSTRQELITDFLKENPQSIFAPRFRNELNRLREGR
jgi:tetratricopeptide (TPR) repeat protein